VMSVTGEGWSIMKTIGTRLFGMVAFAVFALAANVFAQTSGAGILNAVEVRQLAARGEPADSARLAAHFKALADRYTADAKGHASMAQSFNGNPNRSLAAGMSAHCKRLGDLDTQSATTLKELAAYHEKLAAGAAATPPRGGGDFQGGRGAPQPTEKERKALAAQANTPADHRGFEEYFRTLASRYTADARDAAANAQAYRGTKLASAAVHYDRLASLARDAAAEATKAADMEKQFATLPPK